MDTKNSDAGTQTKKILFVKNSEWPSKPNFGYGLRDHNTPACRGARCFLPVLETARMKISYILRRLKVSSSAAGGCCLYSRGGMRSICYCFFGGTRWYRLFGITYTPICGSIKKLLSEPEVRDNSSVSMRSTSPGW